MGTEETDPKKTRVKSAAVNKDIKSTKLTDITFDIFSQLSSGEICRFGDGWILRCPECQELITTDDEFKTYDMSKEDKSLWRLAPSLSCPNVECNWHRSIVIEPEEIIEEEEEEEEAIEETIKAEDTTESIKTEKKSENNKIINIKENGFGAKFNKSLESSP